MCESPSTSLITRFVSLRSRAAAIAWRTPFLSAEAPTHARKMMSFLIEPYPISLIVIDVACLHYNCTASIVYKMINNRN